MAPAAPRSVTAGQNPVIVLEGALETEILATPPGYAFLFRVTFHLSHPRLQAIRESRQKPPLHWHPYQTEYFEVLAGSLTVEIEDEEIELTPESAKLSVQPGLNHRLYPTPSATEGDLIMLLSATDSGIPFQLDLAFFENWYAYQDEILVHGGTPDVIQVMNMFDAGDSYLSFPSWVPCRNFLSYWTGVIVGRWVGSLLGYKPFHPEWTTEWVGACKKMETTIFQRRFAKRELGEAVRNKAAKKGD